MAGCGPADKNCTVRFVRRKKKERRKEVFLTLAHPKRNRALFSGECPAGWPQMAFFGSSTRCTAATCMAKSKCRVPLARMWKPEYYHVLQPPCPSGRIHGYFSPRQPSEYGPWSWYTADHNVISSRPVQRRVWPSYRVGFAVGMQMPSACNFINGGLVPRFSSDQTGPHPFPHSGGFGQLRRFWFLNAQALPLQHRQSG